MKSARAYGIVVGVQLLFLAGLVAREIEARANGTRVVLEVGARDPMDFLSGRYLDVPLVIERIDLERVAHDDPPAAEDGTVFVEIVPGEPNWQPIAVRTKPERGRVFVRGRTVHDFGSSSSVLRVEFDADRFYIPEEANDPSLWWVRPVTELGADRREAETRRPSLSVVARVTRSGRIAVDDLLVDGQSFAEWDRAQPPK